MIEQNFWEKERNIGKRRLKEERNHVIKFSPTTTAWLHLVRSKVFLAIAIFIEFFTRFLFISPTNTHKDNTIHFYQKMLRQKALVETLGMANTGGVEATILCNFDCVSSLKKSYFSQQRWNDAGLLWILGQEHQSDRLLGPRSQCLGIFWEEKWVSNQLYSHFFNGKLAKTPLTSY